MINAFLGSYTITRITIERDIIKKIIFYDDFKMFFMMIFNHH